MKILIKNYLFFGFFVCFTFVFHNQNPVFSKNTVNEKDINFNLSINSLYFPGDEINLNLYSYDYRDQKSSNNQVNFKIQIFKIKNVTEFYLKQPSRYNVDVLGKDSTNLTYLTDEIKTFDKTFYGKRDYGYFYMNETIPLKISEKGAYLIKVTQKNKVAYCGFIISGLGIISKSGANSMLAYTVDRKTGIPISNAELEFYIGSKNIGKGQTNQGLLYYNFNQNTLNIENENFSPLIIGKYGEDIIISDPYLYFNFASDRYVVYMFTNQPVYRTDSEVLFKGTIKKREQTGYKSYSDKEITVIIKDSRGAEVYKKLLKTNFNGSFDGSYVIDKEAPLGIYYIYANIDEKNSSSVSFSVEQYKKPEYKVTVSTDKSQYYGKDFINASIEAKYFFGSPVTEADVEYNIYKIRYYKPWWAFTDYRWWYEDFYAEQDENAKYSGAEFIYSGKGKLDKDGKMTIDYKINEDFKPQGYNEKENWYYYWYYRESDYKYIIQAKVVDKSRREISGTTSVFVTRGGFYMNSKTDKYFYNPGEKVNIEIRTYDFSENPVSAAFVCDIYKVIYNRFDYKEKKDFITTLSGSTKTDGLGIVSYNIPEYDSEGSYFLEIKSKDSQNNDINASAYFYVSKGDMWWYYNQSGGVQIITDRDHYKKGDTCKALVITTVKDANILLTSQNNDIIYYTSDKIEGTSKLFQFVIDEKYKTNFDINVCYVNNGQFFTASKSIMIIPDEYFLTVLIEPSKYTYKPKEEGLIKIKVVDKDGRPAANTEVSLGIVDESIYSIKEDKTKDIRKFFYGKELTTVSTVFNTYNTNYGYSRLITIYERYNIRSTKESELATVKGQLLTKNNIPIKNAIIVIDENYYAAYTDENGNFEFKLPEGNYTIGMYYRGMSKDDLIELKLKKSEIKTIKLYNDKELNVEDYEQRLGVSNELDGRGVDMVEETSVPRTEKESKVYSKRKNGFEKKDEELVTPELRSDFRDAIYWSPYEKTDDNGYATVNIKYPDNLTSWRITTRVISPDTKVGQQINSVITRKDLLVRMETPRFLQDKDQLVISTMIHNYLSTDKNVKVKFKTENAILEGENEKNIKISSDSEARIDWNIKINEPYGEAKFTAEALTNEESDAIEIKVPLQPKGLQIISNTVADITDDNKTETKYINLPENVDIRTAHLKFTVSPSLASTILSALDELAGYPYGCVEQTMSRFLPTVVVADAFKELNVPLNEATKRDLPKMVEAGLNKLYGFQHSDGGWGWWTNDATQPFMTAYVIYGLTIARSAGYDIRENVFNNGLSSLKNQIKNAVDPTTKAYMLYTLALADKSEAGKYKEELEKLIKEDINDYARSLIVITYSIIGDNNMAQKQITELERNVKYIGESAAYWEGKHWHYNWQEDKVQTTSMALKALVSVKSNSDLKDKVVRWLMLQRQGLAWRNTQETAMIIFAMTDYLKTSKELEPDYEVRLFINGQKYYDRKMTKEDVFKKDEVVNIIGKKLKAGANEIKIEKSGKGKVYFSANTSYYKDESKIEPGEYGFRIEREYIKLEKYESYIDKKLTYRKKYFDGTLNSGDVLLVKLKVHNREDNLNYFMLEDPIPAGCEVIKDDWAYTIEGEQNYSGYSYYYWRWWYADKEIRDDRVTFFSTYLNKGEYEFSYIMRTQIPGSYNINPSKGSLMYYPDFNGNSENLFLKIIDKE